MVKEVCASGLLQEHARWWRQLERRWGPRMGRLTYDSTTTVDFEDRLMAHLQLVIGAKLRRNEAFFFSWKNDMDIGDGRGSFWMHPTIPLYFKFTGSRAPSINRSWIDELMLTANTPAGLRIVPEPDASTHDAPEDHE
jgi:hypothetical protein